MATRSARSAAISSSRCCSQERMAALCAAAWGERGVIRGHARNLADGCQGPYWCRGGEGGGADKGGMSGEEWGEGSLRESRGGNWFHQPANRITERLSRSHTDPHRLNKREALAAVAGRDPRCLAGRVERRPARNSPTLCRNKAKGRRPFDTAWMTEQNRLGARTKGAPSRGRNRVYFGR